VANTARVTQSFVLAGTLQNGAARVTQSFIIAGVALGISCGNPPQGFVGVPYSHTFPAGSGNPPYTFAIIAGSLPPGLSLAAATGVVSGTPTTPGTYTFTIQVTDSFTAVASVQCSIVIPPQIAITLYGWKVYPEDPCALPETEAPIPPQIKRAV
jgi:hypothetical protein